MNGYRVFTWDETKFPDVPDMIAKMRADKLRLVTIVDPGIFNTLPVAPLGQPAAEASGSGSDTPTDVGTT